jgi:hypothetical protein
METPDQSAPEGKIPVVYTKEHLEREAAKKRRTEEQKHGEKAAEAALRTPAPYPIDALGPVLKGAVWAIEQKFQCPTVIAANSVLGVSSLAAQAKADVQLPTRQVRPTSLYLKTVAESGDGKSSADGEAMKPVKARETELGKAYEEGLSAYKRKRAAWKAENDKILKGRTDMATKEAQLADLGDEPKAPRIPKLTIKDPTQEGVIKAFNMMPPAIGIFTAEGAVFLTGHGFTPEKKTASGGMYSEMWDGGEISRARAIDGLTFMSGKRLAVHVQVQPDIAKQFLSDASLRNQGFIARILIAQPESLAGTRFWKDPPETCKLLLADYQNAVIWLFQAGKTKGDDGAELDLTTLTMSDQASAEWKAFSDDNERRMQQGGRYANMRDFARKSAEQAARIAGVLTLIESPHAKKVVVDVMNRGITLAHWYLEEARRLIEVHSVSDAVVDGRELVEWIMKQPIADSELGWTVSKRKMQQYGPSRLRSDEKRREAAIDSLCSEHLAYRPSIGKTGGVYVVRPVVR